MTKSRPNFLYKTVPGPKVYIVYVYKKFQASGEQKGYRDFICFLNFLGKQQNFLVPNQKAGVIFSWGIFFFRTKLPLRSFLHPLFLRGKQEISVQRHFFCPQASFTYCIHTSLKQDWEPHNEMSKKFMLAQVETKKSTKEHLRVLYNSPQLSPL